MNYDNEKLKAYLLGELSGADAEAYDELSFTDENFADAVNAAENDLIDAYLNDDLSSADLRKFESVYLATKHRREKVEFARALQTFSEKEIAEKQTKTETEKPGFFAVWNIFSSRALQFGFAAALLVLFFGVFWFAVLRKSDSNVEIARQKSPTPEAAVSINQNVNANNLNNESAPSAVNDETNDDFQNINQTPNTNEKNTNKTQPETSKTPPKKIPPPAPQKPLVATFLLAPPVRGGSNIPVFSFPKNASQVSVGLQLEADEYDSYHVMLTNETGDINLWRRGSLKARNKGGAKFLNINFPAKLLGNGFYSLTVSGINEAGEAEIIANYPFRVTEK